MTPFLTIDAILCMAFLFVLYFTKRVFDLWELDAKRSKLTIEMPDEDEDDYESGYADAMVELGQQDCVPHIKEGENYSASSFNKMFDAVNKADESITTFACKRCGQRCGPGKSEFDHHQRNCVVIIQSAAVSKQNEPVVKSPSYDYASKNHPGIDVKEFMRP